MKWLKHAFAVESDEPLEPTEQQRDVIDRICREIVRRGMTTPALMFLEMSRPLNYLGAQALHFFNPFATVVVDRGGYQAFAEFLEHRGSVDFLCRRLEALEAEGKQAKEDKSQQSATQPDE